MGKIKIAFVRKNPRIRIYKQAKALKETGKYELTLVRYDMNSTTDGNLDSTFINRLFDNIVCYKVGLFKKLAEVLKRGIKVYSKEELVEIYHEIDNMNLAEIVKELDVDIFHVMAEPNVVPEIVVRTADEPVVYDAYDYAALSWGFDNIDESEKRLEKYCLENADGLIRKGPEFEIDFYRQHGYKIGCKDLQWMDYCDEDLFSDIGPEGCSSEKKKLNLVYTGSISEDLNKGYIYNYYIPLAKQLAKEKVHLHIYTNSYMYSQASEYRKLDKEEYYFHFHKPFLYKELSSEIRRYDWGLWIHPVYNDAKVPRANKDKFKVALGNKLFSYLEAGLPVIVSDHIEYGKELVNKYKIGFSVKDEDLLSLKRLIDEQDYCKLIENVVKAREELSLKRNVCTLDEFYREIINV